MTSSDALLKAEIERMRSRFVSRKVVAVDWTPQPCPPMEFVACERCQAEAPKFITGYRGGLCSPCYCATKQPGDYDL